MVVGVVPDVPVVSRRRFDYTVPERWRAELRLGARVRVPFHGRRVGGWVTALGVEPPPGVRLQAITGVSGYGPPPAVLDLAGWASWRWALAPATVLRMASPERNVRHLPAAPPSRGTAARAPERDAVRTAPPAGERGGPRPGPPPRLLRRPPATDLLPLVLEVVGQATGPVVVLVPAAGWAARLADRLRRRGVDVARGWDEAAAGWPVVVGARSAAWAPVPRLGAAVVLDCHDHAERYDAAEVLAERAARDGAPCVLVSPCPTAVQVARYGPAEVPERSAERSGWPAVTVADRRGADPRTGLLSEELVALARRRPGTPERPLVCVLNRTAPLLACAACGELARCTECGRPVEEVGDELVCAGCGAARPVVCTACGATRFAVRRRSVTRLRGELEALFGVVVGEVWGPRQPVPGAPVLVGTEAVLHRVRHAAGVAFLDLDQHLLAPRYTAAEETLALLVRAGRLVGGRGDATAGTVLVQTRLPDHAVLQAAVAGNPGLVTERDVRQALSLPPYAALAVVRSAERPALVGVEVAPLGGERWLVRAPDHTVLCDAVSVLHGGVQVDPTDV